MAFIGLQVLSRTRAHLPEFLSVAAAGARLPSAPGLPPFFHSQRQQLVCSRDEVCVGSPLRRSIAQYVAT